VWVARTVHQLLAGAHPLALVNVDVHAARHRVFLRLGRVVRHDDELALTLDDAAVLDDAVDFRDDRGILRLARTATGVARSRPPGVSSGRRKRDI
jgi:hypothetical protein